MATTSILTNKGASIIDKAITDEAKCVISRVVTSTHYENLPTELAAKSPYWWDGAEGTVTGLSLVNASLDVKVHWNARQDAQPVKSIGLMVKRAGADKDYLLYAESYSNTAVTLERALDRIFSLPINIPAATFDSIGNTMNNEVNEEIEEIGGDMSGLGASLAYDGENTLIQLKNSEGEVLSSIDASDFVIDGMVESVAVVDGYLVITFNTESGKSDISIPVTDFFDASQYYTKTETDSQISSAITALNLGAASQKAVDSSITAQSDVNLPTSSAVKGYVGDEITALSLGAASQKAVDTSIGASSDANLPTSSAVKSYVSSQLPTVNNSSVTIKKNSGDTTNPFSFTLNQSSDAELNIGLADGAFKSVDTAIDAQSDANLPTSGAVKTYVSGHLPTVNNNTITIKKNSSDTINPFSFTLNQSSNAELNIGLGGAAVKDVDTSIGSSSSSNLPTSDAVKAYVDAHSGGGGGVPENMMTTNTNQEGLAGTKTWSWVNYDGEGTEDDPQDDDKKTNVQFSIGGKVGTTSIPLTIDSEEYVYDHISGWTRIFTNRVFITSGGIGLNGSYTSWTNLIRTTKSGANILADSSRVEDDGEGNLMIFGQLIEPDSTIYVGDLEFTLDGNGYLTGVTNSAGIATIGVIICDYNDEVVEKISGVADGNRSQVLFQSPILLLEGYEIKYQATISYL